MKTITPNYYQKFHCIADQCRHSCCIGWEIGIDDATLARYQSESGAFGARLRAKIDEENACFRLDENERCPFLNGQGLCDIILTLGEDALCGICTDHPRFRNYFSSHIEMGLGLCCEEAARLIITQKEPFALSAEPTAEEPAEIAFFQLRARLFYILRSNQLTFEKRAAVVTTLCGGTLPQKPISEWAKIYRSLERLEPAWETLLQQLEAERALPALGGNWEEPSARLLTYFIYRHLGGALEDGKLGARAAFCLLSVTLIRGMAALLQKRGLLTLDVFTELARLYSAEIEYSDENTEILLELLS